MAMGGQGNLSKVHYFHDAKKPIEIQFLHNISHKICFPLMSESGFLKLFTHVFLFFCGPNYICG